MSSTIPAQQHDAPGRDSGSGQLAAFTRVPPQDLDAEQSVIGALILSGTRNTTSYRFFGEILETGIVAEEYYRPAHTAIHRAVCRLHAAGEPVDAITMADELKRRGELARVGGAAYLHTCVQAVPTAANGPSYAEIVRAKAYRRAVIEAAQRVLEYAYSEEGDEDEVRDLVERQLTEIIAGIPGLHEAPPAVGDLLPRLRRGPGGHPGRQEHRSDVRVRRPRHDYVGDAAGQRDRGGRAAWRGQVHVRAQRRRRRCQDGRPGDVLLAGDERHRADAEDRRR